MADNLFLPSSIQLHLKFNNFSISKEYLSMLEHSIYLSVLLLSIILNGYIKKRSYPLFYLFIYFFKVVTWSKQQSSKVVTVWSLFNLTVYSCQSSFPCLVSAFPFPLSLLIFFYPSALQVFYLNHSYAGCWFKINGAWTGWASTGYLSCFIKVVKKKMTSSPSLMGNIRMGLYNMRSMDNRSHSYRVE